MMGKFDKKTVCEYCENEMKSTYRNKRFCSDKCRVYFNREKHKPNIENKENKENILALIELIENTPIPKERDTPNGRFFWKKEMEQKTKILKNKLKLLH